MGAIETFRFNRFELRPAGASLWDYRTAKQWTEADPDHRGRVDPYFWTEQGVDRDAYLLLDREVPIFFFKAIIQDGGRAAEVHIQFPPPAEEPDQARRQRARIASGLAEGLVWLEKVLIQAQVKQLFFESRSQSLITFCVKRLGFTQEGIVLRKRLEGTESSTKTLCEGKQNNVRSN